MEYVTKGSEETKKLAKDFAGKLHIGDIICLYGNLGAGKTTFVQGVIHGLGISKRIISPTFVIMRSYHVKAQQIFYHVDLYRLETEIGIEETGLLDILNNNNAIVAIEWPEKMGALLPKKRWDIKFEYVSDNERKIVIKNT